MTRQDTTRRRLVPGTFPAGDPFPGLSREKAGKFIIDKVGIPGATFEVICRALGGIRLYDLEIMAGDAVLAYHLWVANAATFGLKEGFRAEKNVSHERFREATGENWRNPIAA